MPLGCIITYRTDVCKHPGRSVAPPNRDSMKVIGHPEHYLLYAGPVDVASDSHTKHVRIVSNIVSVVDTD